MKAVVAAFNQEKTLVGAFSVITNLRMQLFEAIVEDEAEMARRRLALLLYLLRSPLYEAGSRAVLVSGLQFSRDNIPLVARLGLAEAMLKYLHEYQEMYFYTWAS